MQLKKYEIKAYVTKDIHQRISQEAANRNTTMANVIRDGIMQYFILREELATAIETPGSLGESHSGKIIHTLLTRTEERIAIMINQLEKHFLETQNRIQLITNMIDQFYLDLMRYLPNIPENMISSANEIARMRHNKWLKLINSKFSY